MPRAVIYARYSPGPNQTEQSIEGQVRECTKYAELHDLRIVGTYVDRKISGKTDNRREFQRMIDDSEKHIFDVIILYHTDRFARNRYDSAIYKHKLKETASNCDTQQPTFQRDPRELSSRASWKAGLNTTQPSLAER